MTYTIFYLVDLNTCFGMELNDKPEHKFLEGYLTPLATPLVTPRGCTIPNTYMSAQKEY